MNKATRTDQIGDLNVTLEFYKFVYRQTDWRHNLWTIIIENVKTGERMNSIYKTGEGIVTDSVQALDALCGLWIDANISEWKTDTNGVQEALAWEMGADEIDPKTIGAIVRNNTNLVRVIGDDSDIHETMSAILEQW